MLHTSKLRDFIGVEIRGVATQDFENENVVKHIAESVNQHELVVIRDLKIDVKDQVKIARRLGKPVPFLLEKYRHPDAPEILISSNEKKDNKPVGMARVGNFWHQDSTFIEDPPEYTMLYGLNVPSTSGHTYFANAIDVLQRLPATWRERLEGRKAAHTVSKRLRIREEHLGLSMAEFKQWIEQHHPKVVHPLILKDPYSQKDFIYGAPEYIDSIIGFTPDENEEFLNDLDRTIQNEMYVYKHIWSPDDVLIWKTHTALHLAGDVESGVARTVLRISIRRF